MGESSKFLKSWTFDIQILKLALRQFKPIKYLDFQVWPVNCIKINYICINKSEKLL